MIFSRKQVYLFMVVSLLMFTGGSLLAMVLPEPVVPESRATDARVLAMGEAFTAVADDSSALYYNPAGLAFLSSGNLKFGLSVLADTNSNFLWHDIYDAEDDLGFDPWDMGYVTPIGGSLDDVIVFVDVNDNDLYDAATDQIEDMMDYGFDNSAEGFKNFQNWYRELVPMVDAIHNVFDEVSLFPNIAFAGSNFGIGLTGGITIQPNWMASYMPAARISSPTIEPMDYGFDIVKRNGVIVGAGFDLGLMAVGANLKYMKETITTFGLPTTSFADFEAYAMSLVPGAMSLEDALYEILMEDSQAIPSLENSYLEAGLGVMSTFGSLTVGAYVDSILGIVIDSNGDLAQDWGDMLQKAARTANIGISYDPSMRKITGSEPLVNLILSADLKNIGDDLNRYLNIGGEFGIHLGGLAKVDVRAGYKQYLTGDVYTILDNSLIDLDRGEVSFGGGMEVFFGEFNVAATVPGGMVRDLLNYVFYDDVIVDPETYYSVYRSNFPRFMFSFGIDI